MKSRPLITTLGLGAGLLALAGLSGCAASSSESMTKIERTSAPSGPSGPSAVVPMPLTPPGSGPVPAASAGTGIQPDIACATPQEEFDIVAVVAKQLGIEAAARLKRLLSTDFKTSDLTTKDRETLKFIARETLWIPAFVERLLGDALFSAARQQLMPVEDDTGKLQAFAARTLGDIVNVSPQTPFKIELMVLDGGTPSGMVGGRVFIDRDTVRDGMATQPAALARRDKLLFIYAHELAHIYKRHHAKRLQEQLLSIDEAHKLATLLLERRGATADAKAVIETMVAAKAIVVGLRSHQADFLRSQEVEADACAASLMKSYRLGDPVRGFATYAKERGQKKQGWTLYDDHPPDEQRKQVIDYVSNSSASARPLPHEAVKQNLERHVKEAAKRDVALLNETTRAPPRR